MKNYLFLCLLAVFTLASCSNDDDSASSNDRILGTWVMTESSVSGFDPNACTEDSFLTFNEDETGTATFYREQNNCEPENASGEWENLGSSTYRIEVPVLGSQTGMVRFEGADTFIFTPAIFPGSSFTFERQ